MFLTILRKETRPIPTRNVLTLMNTPAKKWPEFLPEVNVKGLEKLSGYGSKRKREN